MTKQRRPAAGRPTKRRKAAARSRVNKPNPTPPSPPPLRALDSASGALRFDGADIAFGPRLTRTEFLASALGRAAKDLVVNEPWHSWQLVDRRIGEDQFLVGVFFEGERLNMLQLYLSDPRYGTGTGWEDFSPEKEEARTVAQRRWLRGQLGDASARSPSGDERRFSWGEASVSYDPHNQQSSIVISYRGSDKPDRRSAKAPKA